ncbi:MAG: hypothetical protein ABJZ55_15015 [Fuerstiella sp.]
MLSNLSSLVLSDLLTHYLDRHGLLVVRQLEAEQKRHAGDTLVKGVERED